MAFEISKSELAEVLADSEVATLVKQKLIALKTGDIDAVLAAKLKEVGIVAEVAASAGEASVAFSAAGYSINKGDKLDIELIVTGDGDLKVTSSDEKLATVTTDGTKATVSGLGEGEVKLTASKGKASAEAKLTVK